MSTIGANRADLVTTQWLQDHLGAPGLKVLDCTTFMTPQPVGPSRIESGRARWAQARIPGAQHVCMVEDLSDPAGRFPYTLPQAADLRRRLGERGIHSGQHLVLYGSSHPMVVTRAWWVFTALGWPRVSVLDGGWATWLAEGRPVDQGPPQDGPAELDQDRPGHSPSALRPIDAGPGGASGHGSVGHEPQPACPDRLADAQAVAQAVDTGSAWLVNALSVEQFLGTGGAHYGRPGRIPGSISLPARDLVEADPACWLAPESVRERARQAGLVNDGRPVIVYCGGGIAATATAFALERAGWADVRVYDNSLLEWSADPARPMTTG